MKTKTTITFLISGTNANGKKVYLSRVGSHRRNFEKKGETTEEFKTYKEAKIIFDKILYYEPEYVLEVTNLKVVCVETKEFLCLEEIGKAA